MTTRAPTYFWCRVGRTARAGRTGSSLLLLLPKEESYLQLLALKSVPVRAWTVLTDGMEKTASAVPREAASASAPGAPVFDDAASLGSLLCAAMQAEAIADRDLLEKGTTAFVTFVRGCVRAEAVASAFESHLCPAVPEQLTGTANTCSSTCSSLTRLTFPRWLLRSASSSCQRYAATPAFRRWWHQPHPVVSARLMS